MTCFGIEDDCRNDASVYDDNAMDGGKKNLEMANNSLVDPSLNGSRQISAAVGRCRGCSVTASTTDSCCSWLVVAGCFVAQALAIGSTYTFGVIYVELLQEFRQSKAATAWIGSIQTALLYMTGMTVGLIFN
jgi:hypothetical protein